MSRKIKILFLAANPLDTLSLRLDEELRGMDQALLRARFRDRFELEQQWAVQVADLQHHLLRYKPDIVHFSGHGSASNEIILEDKSGQSHPVSVRALSELFRVLKDNIRCVVLNACYSEPQAQAIAEEIDCVIGMSKAIGDDAAISFAAAFYQALGYGRDVKTAFDLGCLQIDLENLDEQDTPQLLARNIGPEEVVFVSDIAERTSYRVKRMAKVTHKIIEAVKQGKEYLGSLRNEYVDSMVVAIERLAKTYDKFEEDKWPCLIDDDLSCFEDHEKNRRDWFKEHVKPALKELQDISDPSPLDELAKELCIKLEAVVGHLDAAFACDKKDGNGNIMIRPGRIRDKNRIFIKANDKYDESRRADLDQLKAACSELHDTWEKWVRSSKSLLMQ